VKLQGLLYVQTAAKVLRTHVVDIQIVQGSDRTNAVEDVFGVHRARNGVDVNVGVRQHVMNCGGHGIGDLFGALESHVPRQPDRKICKVAVASSADANAINLEQAIHPPNGGDNIAAHSSRRCVQQSVNSSPRQTPTDIHNHSCHDERGNGVSITKPADTVGLANHDQRQPQHDYAARPNVCREMKRVCLESLAVIFRGDPAQGPWAPVMHDHGEEHKQEGGEARLDFYMVEEEGVKVFVDDLDAGQQEQSGFDESGEIFDFAMPVLVIGIGGLV